MRSNYNPIYPEPVDDDYVPPVSGESGSSPVPDSTVSGTSPVSRESGLSNAPISSEGNTSEGNNSNQLPL